jgi:streptogramin lyase
VLELSATGNVVAEWGGTGGARPIFSEPAGVAVNGWGAVIVADSGHNRLVQLSPQGQPLYVRHDGFSNPQGLAVDAAGDVFVADQNNSRIVKLSSDGRPLPPWGTGDSGASKLNAPYAVALDPHGDLWVLDAGTPALHEFSPAGKLLKEAQPGTQPVMLYGGMAIGSDGRVNLTGGPSGGLSVFSPSALSSTSENSPAATYGGVGSQGGQFQSPKGIAIDGRGDRYIADTGNDRVEVLSAGGAYLFAVGEAGTGPGRFALPGGIAVDDRGEVFVSDSNNNRVQKLVPVR